MEKIKITMNLDPLNDGIKGIENYKFEEEQSKEVKEDVEGIVISTTGDYKKLNTREFIEIMAKLSDNAEGIYLGKYFAVIPVTKEFCIAGDTYFVGSMVVFKGYEDEDETFTEQDIQCVYQAMSSKIEKIMINGEPVWAFRVN